RWVVERDFAWATRFRRLVRDYERLPETVAGLHFVAFAVVMLHRLITLAAQSPSHPLESFACVLPPGRSIRLVHHASSAIATGWLRAWRARHDITRPWYADRRPTGSSSSGFYQTIPSPILTTVALLPEPDRLANPGCL